MTPEEFSDSLAGYNVPEHLQEGLMAYMTQRRPVGGFLTACLENDLCGAVGRAADMKIIEPVVRWLWNEVPAPAWGSKEAVAAWLAAKPGEGDGETT